MRYVSRVKQFDDVWDSVPFDGPRELTVFEAEMCPTGLLDALGNPIYAQPDKIGFRLKDE